MSKHHPELINPALGKQVHRAALALVLRHLPLGIDARKLNDQLAWEIVLYASVHQITIEAACQQLLGAPSGNTVRSHLTAVLPEARAEIRSLEDELNRTLRAQLPVRVRRRWGRLQFDIAIDLVPIPYHGQAQADAQEVCRNPAKAGTTHFHMYGTLAIVYHRHRYTVAVTMVWADEKMETIAARLLDEARRSGLWIRRAYLDKGFSGTEVLRLLRRRHVPYIVPLPARGGAGGIKQLFGGRCSYHTRYTFNRHTSRAYTTEVVIACKYSRGKYGRHRVEYFAYAVYGLGRIQAHQVFELYRRRFGIETGYRQMHRVRARTASRHPGLRLLLVAVALLLVNCYVLLRQQWCLLSQSGQRVRVIELTLDRVAEELREYLVQVLGKTTVIHIHSFLKDTLAVS